MYWVAPHRSSEALASRAHSAIREGDLPRARLLFIQAAEAEELALEQIETSKPRTLGIMAVSAASLWYKAGAMRRCIALARKWLKSPQLNEYARAQLEDLIHSASTDDPPAAADFTRISQSGEYLIFRLGPEEYGIDILKVQEIRTYEQPTLIASVPDFIKGVVNLRGIIIPIVDLRLKLHCPTIEYNSSTTVVVLNVKGQVVGAVVDSVSEVIELRRDAISSPSESNQIFFDRDSVIGVANENQRRLVLLNVDQLLGTVHLILPQRFRTPSSR